MNGLDTLPTLASVVFIRVADYTRRPVAEQARLRSQLEAAVAVALKGVPDGCRILLDAPDGMAVAVLRNPQAALDVAERCTNVMEIGIPLSIGVNHGAIQLEPDESNHPGLIGDAIGVAASIAEYGGPQRVTVSRAFVDALAEASPLRARGLKRAGTYTDPQVRTHELFTPHKTAQATRRKVLITVGSVLTAGLVASAVAIRTNQPEPEFAPRRPNLRERWRVLRHRFR